MAKKTKFISPIIILFLFLGSFPTQALDIPSSGSSSLFLKALPFPKLTPLAIKAAKAKRAKASSRESFVKKQIIKKVLLKKRIIKKKKYIKRIRRKTSPLPVKITPLLNPSPNKEEVDEGNIAPVTRPEYKEGELIVAFKEGTTPEQIDEINVRLNTSVKSNISAATFSLQINDGSSVLDKVAQYKSEEAVEYAEPNYIVRVQPVPDQEPSSKKPETSTNLSTSNNLNPSGTNNMYFYTGQTNYETNFAEAGENLVASTQEFDVALPKKLSEDSSESIAFQLKNKEAGIRFKPLSINTTSGVIVDSSVVYKNIWEGVDLKFEVNNNSLKELLILSKVPQVNKFEFAFAYFGDIYLKEEDKKLVFYDKSTDQKVFAIPPLFMYDTNRIYNLNIERSIESASEKLKLIYLLDDSWLKSEERAYPVIVDPTLEQKTGVDYSGSQNDDGYGDTFINSFNGVINGTYYPEADRRGENFDYFDGLYVGSSGNFWEWGIEGATYSILKFDVSPATGSIIKQADLYLAPLYEKTPITNSTLNTLILQAIDSPYNLESLTWNNQPASGARFSINATEVISDGWVRFDVKQIVQEWASGSYPNYGFLLHTINDSSSTYFKVFGSAETGQAGPVLAVAYNNVPEVITLSPTSDGRYYPSTPTFEFIYKDKDGDSLDIDNNSRFNEAVIEIAKTNDFSAASKQVIRSFTANSVVVSGSENYKDGVRLQITPPASEALPDGAYWWRVAAQDGYDVTYSTPLRFKVMSAPNFTLDITFGADGRSVNTPLPTFTWTLSDPDGDLLDSWFRYSNNANFENDGLTNWFQEKWWFDKPPGTKLSYQLPDALPDGTYYFRLEVWDKVPTSIVGYASSPSASWSWSASSPVGGDFNNDGNEDLGIFYGDTNQTNIFRYATFNWGNPGDYAFSGDFDADGKVELALQRYNPDNTVTYFIANLAKNSDGSYKVASSYSWFNLGAKGDRVFAADYNNDGKDDIIIQRETTFILCNVIKDTATGLYTSAREYGRFNWGNRGDIGFSADFNNNALDDLVVQRGNLFIAGNVNYNAKNRVYSAAEYGRFYHGNTGDKAFSGEFNGDGKDDIALQRGSTFYLANVVYNSSTKTYSAITYSTFAYGNLGDQPFSGKFALGGDSNNKSNLGLFRTASSQNAFYLATVNGQTRFMLYTANGTDNTNFLTSLGPVWDSGIGQTWNNAQAKYATGDFNGDGTTDVVALYNYGTYVRFWFFYKSAGIWNFRDAIQRSWNWSKIKLTVGDYNGDGKDDLFVLRADDLTSSSLVSIFRSTYSGNAFTFAEQPAQTLSGYVFSAVTPLAGNFNGDLNNRKDLALVYEYSSNQVIRIFVLLSNGTSLNSPVRWWSSEGTPGNWQTDRAKYASGDFNGDNKDDILFFYDYGSKQTKIWHFLSKGGITTTSADPDGIYRGGFYERLWRDSGVGNWAFSPSKLYTANFDANAYSNDKDPRDNLGILYDYVGSVKAWGFKNVPLNSTSVSGVFVEINTSMQAILPYRGQQVNTSKPIFYIRAIDPDENINLTLQVFDDKNGNGLVDSSDPLVFTTSLSGVNGFREITPLFSLPDANYIWRVTTSTNPESPTFTSDTPFTIITPPKVSNVTPKGYLTETQPLLSFSYSDPNKYALRDAIVELSYDKEFKFKEGLPAFSGGKNTSFVIPYPLADGTYYYRITAINDKNIASNPSPIASFSINTAKNAVYEAKVSAGLPSATTVYIPVIVKNTGTKIIKKDEVVLSYRFFNLTTNRSISANPKQTSLPFDLPPGQSAMVKIEVWTPSQVNIFKLRVELKEKKGSWFSAYKADVFEQEVTIQDQYKATYSSRAPPSITQNTDSTFTAPVTVRNTSNRTWLASGTNPVRLSYHILDTQGNAIIYNGLRTTFSSNIAPGQTVTLNASVQIPATLRSDIFVLAFDLVEELVSWFSDKGVATLNYPLAVRALGTRSYLPAAGGVNLANGNLTISGSDFDLGGRGPNLSITRTYNSQAQSSSLAGYGWKFNFEQKLTDYTSFVQIELGDGEVIYFDKRTDESYKAQSRVYLRLTKNAIGYILEDAQKNKIFFASGGLLNYIADANNNTLDFIYNTSNQLVRIKDSSSREVSLFYDASGRVNKIKYPAANARGYSYTTYSYNTAGDLIAVSADISEAGYGGLDLTTIYTYSNRKLIAITSPSATSTLRMEYTTDGKISKLIDPTSTPASPIETIFSYDLNNFKASVINPKEATTTYYFNDYFNLAKLVTADSNTTYFYYDNKDNLLATDDAKATTIYQYDDTSDRGWANQTTVTTVDKETLYYYESSLIYDENNFAVVGKDSKGNKTLATYDDAGNVLNLTDSTGVTTVSKYDAFGNPIYVTDGIASSSNIIYNSNLETDADADNIADGFKWGWSYSGTSSARSIVSYGGNYSLSQAHTVNNQKSVWYTDTAADSITPYTKYLISAWLKTDTAVDNTGGVKIWVGFNKNDNTRLLDIYSQTYKTNGDWQRIYLVALAPKDAKRLRLHFLQENFLGTSYIDAISVEEAMIVSPYNIVENAGFEVLKESTTNWISITPDFTSAYWVKKQGVLESDGYQLINFAEPSFVPDTGGFIRKWLLLGDFESTPPEYSYFSDYLLSEPTLKPYEGLETNSKSWNRQSSTSEVIDLKTFLSTARRYPDNPNPPYSSQTSYKSYAAYAHVYVYSETNWSGYLKVGASDNPRAWLNGSPVQGIGFGLGSDERRWSQSINNDDYVGYVTLKTGLNRLLIKVEDAGVKTGDVFGFEARFTETNGIPKTDLKLYLSPLLPGLGEALAPAGDGYAKQTHENNSSLSYLFNQTPVDTIAPGKEYTISAYLKTEAIFDNFSDGTLGSFEPVEGVFRVENSELSQNNILLDKSIIVTGATSLKNFILESEIKLIGGDSKEVSLLFGYKNRESYYLATLKGQTSEVAIYKGTSLLSKVALGFSPTFNQSYKLKLEISNSTFKLYVGEALKLTATDSEYKGGRVGLSTSKTHAHFDNFKLSVPGGTGGARVNITFADKGGNDLATYASPIYKTDGKWQLIAFDAKAPVSASFVKVRLIQQNFEGSTYFDSIRIQERISSKAIYDSSGNYPVQIEDALGNKTDIAYDLVGNQRTVATYKKINPADTNLTATTTSYTYDAISRLVAVQAPVSNQSSSYDYYNPSYATTTYEYDKDSRLIKVTAPDGLKTIKTYLANGLLESVVTTLNDKVSGTIQITANATDASSIQKVAFYVDSTLRTTDFSAPYNFNFDTTTIINDKHDIKVIAYDILGNFSEKIITLDISNAASTSTYIDATPPIAAVITSPTNSSWISSTTPAISFSPATDNVAISKYQLYIDSKLAVDNIAANATSVSLTTPLANGSHIISLLAIDANGNSTKSADISFGVDTTAPSITIISPANNEAFKGGIYTIKGSASSNYAPLNRVQVSTDGINWFSASGTNSWTYNLNTSTSATYNIRVRAISSTNAVSNTTVVSLTVDNTAPAVAITSPANNSTVSRTISINVNATDASSIQKVELYVDNVLNQTDTASPYSFSVYTALLANGAHTLKAIAYDILGNSASSSITVNTTNFVNWKYRMQIAIPGTTATNLTNYPIMISVDTAKLIAADKMKADGSDIRFANASGTELPYWIERDINTAYTKIWVKLDTIFASPATTNFYIYYGNPSAIAASNGLATFDFFENFNGTALNTTKWAADTSGGTVTVSGGYATLENTTGGAVNIYTKVAFNATSSYLVDIKHYESYYYRNRFYLTAASGGSLPTSFDYGYFVSGTKDVSTTGQIYWNGWQTTTISANTDYLTRLRVIDGSTYTWTTYTYPTMTMVNGRSTTVSSILRYIKIGVTSAPKAKTSVDWIRVRKYVVGEPVARPPGSEELLITSFDTTAPGSFSITSPVFGSWITSTTPTISWSPSTDAVKYQLFIDGKLDTDNLAVTKTTPSSNPANGLHIAYVVAYDAAGNSINTPTITFGIDTTTPNSTITSPASGTYKNAVATISGSATSAISGISKVEVRVNGNTWELATGTNSWTKIVNLQEGVNTIEARAYSNTGNIQVTPSAIGIVIDSTAPQISSLTTVPGIDMLKTTYEYDQVGNVVATHNDPYGFNQTATATYDIMGRLISATDPLGNTVTNAFDALGNLIRVTDARGYTTSFNYDGIGQKISETDAKGYTDYFAYDANGNLAVNTYPATNPAAGRNVAASSAGARIEALAAGKSSKDGIAYYYDYSAAIDGIISATNYAEIYSKIDPHPSFLVILDKTYTLSSIKVNLLYKGDSRGYKFKVETSLDNKNFKTILNKTDAFNSGLQEAQFKTPLAAKFIKVTAIAANIPASYPAEADYFQVSEIEAVTPANSIVYDYDGKDRLISQTDALGYTSFNYYNQSNELAFSVDAKGNVTSYEYDTLSRLTKAINPLGRYTRTTYDEVGNEKGSYDQLDVKQETNTYDVSGALRKTINAINHKSENDYDLLGRVKESSSYRLRADGSLDVIAANKVNYDTFGRVSENIDSLGYRTSQDYDSLSRVVAVWDKNANYYNPTHDLSSAYKPTKTTYLLDNKVDTVTDQIGITSKNQYDASGNLVASIADYGTSTLNQKTTFFYNELNRLIKVVDPRGNVSGATPDNFATSFTYDGRGNKTTMTDSKGTTTYKYDEDNRLIENIDPLGKSTYFVYDPEGLLLSASNSAKSISYTYDANNRLIKETYPDATLTSFEYDAKGRLIKVSYPNSIVTTFAYDIGDRLVSKNENGKTTAYQYDSNDNLTRLTDSLGNVTTYTYDAEDKLTAIKDSSGATLASFEYDPNGNLTKKTLRNGVVTTYAYDPSNRLISIKTTKGTTTLDEVSTTLGTLVYDNLDNILKFKANNYVYDIVEQLAQDNEYIYTYDGNGNLLTKRNKSTGATTTYTYNNANQLTSDGTKAYAYDESGNLKSDGTYTYAYDAKDRLIQVKQGATVIASYTYDTDNLRTSKVKGESTYTYIYNDSSNMLSQEINSTAKTFVGSTDEYDQLISLKIGVNTYYYVYDVLGQIIGLTDSVGNWVVKYTYDSWGVPTEYNGSGVQQAVGTFVNPYLYKNYYYDSETGFYYLNARYYNPKIGRFLTRDPDPGKATHRLSLNTYAYAYNNPISNNDPNGHGWWSWLSDKYNSVRRWYRDWGSNNRARIRRLPGGRHINRASAALSRGYDKWSMFLEYGLGIGGPSSLKNLKASKIRRAISWLGGTRMGRSVKGLKSRLAGLAFRLRSKIGSSLIGLRKTATAIKNVIGRRLKGILRIPAPNLAEKKLIINRQNYLERLAMNSNIDLRGAKVRYEHRIFDFDGSEIESVAITETRKEIIITRHAFNSATSWSNQLRANKLPHKGIFNDVIKETFFHESIHVGQINRIRRFSGLPITTMYEAKLYYINHNIMPIDEVNEILETEAYMRTFYRFGKIIPEDLQNMFPFWVNKHRFSIRLPNSTVRISNLIRGRGWFDSTAN